MSAPMLPVLISRPRGIGAMSPRPRLGVTRANAPLSTESAEVPPPPPPPPPPLLLLLPTHPWCEMPPAPCVLFDVLFDDADLVSTLRSP